MARQLTALGFDAAALKGGYAAWKAAQPVEPKVTARLQRESLPTT